MIHGADSFARIVRNPTFIAVPAMLLVNLVAAILGSMAKTRLRHAMLIIQEDTSAFFMRMNKRTRLTEEANRPDEAMIGQ